MRVLKAVQDIIMTMEYVKMRPVWLTFFLNYQIHYMKNIGYEYVSAIYCIIECFGAAGPDCLMPCNNNSFGYQCKNSCDCQKHEICKKYFGCLAISKLRFKVAYILLVNFYSTTELTESTFFKFHI